MKQRTLNPAEDRVSDSANTLPKALAERFEAAWKSADSSESRPRIQDYLVTIPEPDRSSVFSTLLAVELKCRQQAGEQPILEEYCFQFPDASALIESVFHDTGLSNRARTPMTSPAQAGGRGIDQAAVDPLGTVDYRTPVGANGHAPLDGQSAQITAATQPRDVRPLVLNAPPPDLPGYLLLDKLGNGAMGVVYLARHLQLQRLVALKMILPGREFTPGALERFLAEASAVARFQHPNLVQIYDIGERDGLPYFSLEYVDGGSLARKLAGAPQPPLEAAALLETLALAVNYAHEKGIVHRDLKPSNILLTADGTPKIADFGLAKPLDGDAGTTEHGGGVLGTPSYMAPEQAWGKSSKVGPAADVYALGSILYDALTGRPPFKTADKWETIELVKTQDPPPPRLLVPQLPRDLELICLKCLQKEPGDRFASARDLADELRRFQEGRPILTRPTPVWERAWKWARRRPAAASLIGVSAVALLSLILYLDQRRATAEHKQNHQLQIAQRAEKLSNQVHESLLDARALADRGQIAEARGKLQAAVEIVRAEPSLQENLNATLAALAKELDRGEAEENGRRAADHTYREFFQLRDAALLANGMAYTGVEHDANIEATIKNCRAALAKFQLDDASTGGPAFPKLMSDDRRRQCIAVCYELFLIRAGAEAQPAPGRARPTDEQVDIANRLLDRASQLGVPTTMAYHLRRADYLERQNNFVDAGKERRLAAAAKPDALDYFLMGDAKQKQRRFTEAARDFAATLSLQNNHFWARYFLAMCNLQSGQAAAARDNLTACMITRDDLHWLYLLRGFANGLLDDFTAAENDFDRASELLQKQPDAQAHYGILVNRGNICMRQAQTVERALPLNVLPILTPNVDMTCRAMAEAYRHERLASASAWLRQAIDLKPDQYPAYRSLALVVRLQGEVDEAIQLIGKAIDAPGERLPQIQGQLYGQRARWRLEQSKAELAEADLVEALRLFPTAADFVERGKIKHRRRLFNEALLDYAHAIEWQPTETAAYRLQAEAHMSLEQYEAAASSLDAYLARNGQRTADVFRARGRAFAQLYRHSLAVADYTHALELQPDSATYAERGLVHLVNDNVEAADRDFRKAIELNSTNANAYAGRGLVYARRGKHAEALADVKHAREYAPNDPQLLWEIAHVYAHLAADAALLKSKTVLSRENYQEAGVNLLHQALVIVPKDKRKKFWHDRIELNSLLDPLRGSPAFDRLEREWLLTKKGLFGS